MTRNEISILVVDDVNAMRIKIRHTLTEFGFKNITTVENIELAIRALDTTPVDLILCDWHMFPTDGLDLLKHIRGIKKFAQIPFIMLTAETTRENVIRAIGQGVDDYVTKPFQKDTLEVKIIELLHRKGLLS